MPRTRPPLEFRPRSGSSVHDPAPRPRIESETAAASLKGCVAVHPVVPRRQPPRPVARADHSLGTAARRKYRPFAHGLVNGSYPTLCCRSQPIAERDGCAEADLRKRLCRAVGRFNTSIHDTLLDPPNSRLRTLRIGCWPRLFGRSGRLHGARRRARGQAKWKTDLEVNFGCRLTRGRPQRCLARLQFETEPRRSLRWRRRRSSGRGRISPGCASFQAR